MRLMVTPPEVSLASPASLGPESETGPESVPESVLGCASPVGVVPSLPASAGAGGGVVVVAAAADERAAGNRAGKRKSKNGKGLLGERLHEVLPPGKLD